MIRKKVKGKNLKRRKGKDGKIKIIQDIKLKIWGEELIGTNETFVC